MVMNCDENIQTLGIKAKAGCGIKDIAYLSKRAKAKAVLLST
jgi:hypothetical protein